MKYEVKKLENSMVQILLNLNDTEWQAEVNEAYNKNKGKYAVEGFRKGKAPRKVIEQAYGDHVFYEEALSEGFYKAYMEILSKEPSIDPVDAPSLKVNKLDATGIEIEAEIIVKPEAKVKKYTGFGINVEEKAVSAQAVNTELENLRQKNVRLVTVDKAIENGFVANINFSGSVDGVKFQGGTAENFDLEIGTKSFIDNFEDQLVGLKAGDTKNVNVTFPKEYHAKELAGKPALFECVVNAVKEKQLPELNDEFASNVSDFETMAEYKKDIEAGLKKQAAEQAKVNAENKIIDKILENTEVSIPEAMINNELENILKDMEYSLMYQGINLETYAKYLNTTVDKIKADKKADAEKSVKIRLALTHILQAEKMDVTDKEVDAKIEELAKSAKKTVKEFKENITPERINYIKNDILMSKLLEFLLKNNAK